MALPQSGSSSTVPDRIGIQIIFDGTNSAYKQFLYTKTVYSNVVSARQSAEYDYSHFDEFVDHFVH